MFFELATSVVAAYKARGLKIATAESCTGGLIAATLTDIAGSSAIFDCGFVTYSNTAKCELIGVSPKTITQYGAVSEETAREMAHGAFSRSNADIAVAVTGIAGPDGGSVEKPVGLVYMALVGVNNFFQEIEWRFDESGTRDEIRNMVVDAALEELETALTRL